MQLIFTFHSEFGWLACPRISSLLRFWWRVLKWHMSLQEDLKTIYFELCKLRLLQPSKIAPRRPNGRKCSWVFPSSTHWSSRGENTVHLVGTSHINSLLQISPYHSLNWKCSWMNTNSFLIRRWTTWPQRLITVAGSLTPWIEGSLK